MHYDKQFPLLSDILPGISEVSEITIDIVEKNYGNEIGKYHYSKSTIGHRFNCHNQLCKYGGFDLISVIQHNVLAYKLTEFEVIYPCQGKEAVGRGSKAYCLCNNKFYIKIKVTYYELNANTVRPKQ